MWVVGPPVGAQRHEQRLHGPFYRTTALRSAPIHGIPAGVTAIQVGTATMTFTSGSAGTFNYTVNGITQTKNITKQVFGTPATVCR
jgi:hypothetical protein